MGEEKVVVAIKVIVPVIATILWLLLYFTVLWRLPFIWNLNRVKVPKDCKEVATDVIWSDLEIMHIKAERVFSSERSREELEDYINKNNSHLGRIDFGWWSYPEYDHVDAVDPEDYPELWDGDCYVLTYSTWGTGIDAVVFLAGGILGTVLGIIVYVLMEKMFHKKMNYVFPVYPDYGQDTAGKMYSVTSLIFGICSILPYVFLLTGLPELPEALGMVMGMFTYVLPLFLPVAFIGGAVLGIVFGIVGKEKGGAKIANTGMAFSYLGFCLALGIPFVYFLIADFWIF